MYLSETEENCLKTLSQSMLSTVTNKFLLNESNPSYEFSAFEGSSAVLMHHLCDQYGQCIYDGRAR